MIGHFMKGEPVEGCFMPKQGSGLVFYRGAERTEPIGAGKGTGAIGATCGIARGSCSLPDAAGVGGGNALRPGRAGVTGGTGVPTGADG